MTFYKKNNSHYLHLNNRSYEAFRSIVSGFYTLDDDIPFQDLAPLTGLNIPRNVKISSDISELTQYQHLNYFNILRVDNQLQITAEANYWLNDWNEKINLLSFLSELQDQTLSLYLIDSQQQNIFDEGLINIGFTLTVECNANFHMLLKMLDTIIQDEHENILNQQFTEYQLSLPKQHLFIGRSLLHLLPDVLKYMKLDDDASISIKEHRKLIQLQIKHPVHKSKQIRKAVHQYGLFIMGKIAVSHLLKNKQQQSVLAANIKHIEKFTETQLDTYCNAPTEVFSSPETELQHTKNLIGLSLEHEFPKSTYQCKI